MPEAVGEFDLIARYFSGHALLHPDNRLGIGDDCALLTVPAGYQLAVTTDTMVENVHFFALGITDLVDTKRIRTRIKFLIRLGANV